MKLWQKNNETPLGDGGKGDMGVGTFTVGNDRELDLSLAPFDVLGSLAHIQMLASIGLLTKKELQTLQKGLKEIYKEIQSGKFKLDDDVEDIHSQVEFLLTKKFGDSGKKIHSARSRNDQVLVDLKLFTRNQIELLVYDVKKFFDLLFIF